MVVQAIQLGALDFIVKPFTGGSVDARLEAFHQLFGADDLGDAHAEVVADHHPAPGYPPQQPAPGYPQQAPGYPPQQPAPGYPPQPDTPSIEIWNEIETIAEPSSAPSD